MHNYSKEIRTPKKNLLVGIISRENDHLYLTIKNRGKMDRIGLEMLLSDIYQAEKISLNPSKHS